MMIANEAINWNNRDLFLCFNHVGTKPAILKGKMESTNHRSSVSVKNSANIGSNRRTKGTLRQWTTHTDDNIKPPLENLSVNFSMFILLKLISRVKNKI